MKKRKDTKSIMANHGGTETSPIRKILWPRTIDLIDALLRRKSKTGSR
jgi:hypothetical protein